MSEMGFDSHTYQPSACKHCYTLFTCTAHPTLPFWVSPQSTLPDGADTAVLCSTDVAFLSCQLSVLFPQASPSPLLTLLSSPYDVFLTNFTYTLSLSSHSYFYSRLLTVIISFVSSKALPTCVLSV